MEFSYTIQSAIPREEIIAYFSKLYPFHNIFHYFQVDVNTTISVGETQEISNNPFRILHTQIFFQGTKEVVANLVSDFRRVFLRAGG